MNFKGLKIIIGGNLEDGFGAPWIPEPDVAIHWGGDDLSIDAPLSVDVDNPTLMLTQRHHSGKKKETNVIKHYGALGSSNIRGVHSNSESDKKVCPTNTSGKIWTV